MNDMEFYSFRIVSSSASSAPEWEGGTAYNGYARDYCNHRDAVWDAPQEELQKLPKYDPFGARQLWQPGYPRVRPLRKGDLLPALTPRFNQVRHTARPLHGRRRRKQS